MPTHAPETAAAFTVLHGSHSSVVLEVLPYEAPLWRYWSPRLPDHCVPLVPLRDGRRIPPSSMEFDQPLTVAPTLAWAGMARARCWRTAVGSGLRNSSPPAA